MRSLVIGGTGPTGHFVVSVCARTEKAVFELQPQATHFRYPYVYGPHQLAPREWLIVRRILDGRKQIILPEDGLTLNSFGYAENLAHALLLAVDKPEVASLRASKTVS